MECLSHLNASRLVVPALSGGENDVEDGLRGQKSQGSGASSNSASNKIRCAIRDSNNIDQKVLVGEVCSVGSDKESGGTANDSTEGGIGLGVFVSRLFDVAHESTEDGSTGTKTSVEGKTTTNPGSGKDSGKAEVGSLKSVDKRLPCSSTAESGGSEKEGSLELGFHVDGGIDDCLLGTIVEAVTGEDSNTVTDTGGESKVHGVCRETKIVLGDDGGSLPPKSSRENLGHCHFGSHDEPIDNGAGWCRLSRRRIGFGHGRAVDLSAFLFLFGEGRRGCHGRHHAGHAMVAIGISASVEKDTGGLDRVHDGHWI